FDTAHIQQGVMLQVNPGTHIIKIWAPSRELVIDTFQTYADSFFVYTKNLPYIESFLQYKSVIRKEKNKALFPLIATGIVVVASGVIHIDLSLKIDNDFDKAQSAKAYYDLAISQPQLDYYENQYNDNRDKYD